MASALRVNVLCLRYGQGNHHSLNIFFEMATDGSLADAATGEWSAARRLKSMMQLASGMAHLHQLGIAHLDLKPDNVLIFPGRILKVPFAVVSRSPLLCLGRRPPLPPRLSLSVPAPFCFLTPLFPFFAVVVGRLWNFARA